MKKIMYVMIALAVSVTTCVLLSSFTTSKHVSTDFSPEIHTHSSCQGKHCTYTVGCGCSGFSPITNGKVWQESYCKRCGHHKMYHR